MNYRNGTEALEVAFTKRWSEMLHKPEDCDCDVMDDGAPRVRDDRAAKW